MGTKLGGIDVVGDSGGSFFKRLECIGDIGDFSEGKFGDFRNEPIL